MSIKKHKRKVSRIIIFTTDAVDTGTKQIKIRSWVAILLTLVVCILLGSIIGYVIYEDRIWEMARKKDLQREEELKAAQEALTAQEEELNAQIDSLQEEIDSLQQEKDTLTEEKATLSGTILGLQDQIKALENQIQQESVPTDYPLTGPAGIEEITGDTPMVIFTASEGSAVIASAKGVVASIEADQNYGNKITVDHGNGYISIFYNTGDVQVKAGDEVATGTTLFLIGADNKQLVYQIVKDGVFISPTEILSING